MPYLETAQSWLTQSALLLQARPLTTRITTKYTIKPHPDPSKPSKSKPRKPKPTTNLSSTTEGASANPALTPDPIRATLVLKTFDPASGTTLKYSTTRAAEVSRLIQILGRLARPMAGLPEVKEDAATVDATGAGDGSGVATPALDATPAAGGKAVGQAGGPGVGNKKGKKRGKK